MAVTLCGMTVFWHPTIKVFVAEVMMAWQFSRLSKTGFCGLTTMLSRFGQSAKAIDSMLVTLSEIESDVNPLHS